MGLSSNQAALTVPASITIGVGLTSGTFNATTAAISVDQSATLTATYNSSSAPATISLIAPALVSSLVCNPNTLISNSASNCTVTLSKAAPAGNVVVSLASNSALLGVPASVTVLSGAASASFAAAAGVIPASQSASVTATYNSSSQSASISLITNSVTCNFTGLMSAGTTTCTLTLTQAAVANTPVALSSNSPLLTVPASVTVASGSSSAVFTATAGTIPADTSAVITANFGSSVQNFTLALWSTPTLVSLTCSPTAMTVGSSGTCTVTLSKSAAAITIALTTSDLSLSIPSTATVAQGAATGTFKVTAVSLPKGWVILSSSWNGGSKSAIITVSAATGSAQSSPASALSARASSLSCTPKKLSPGESGVCKIGLTGASDSATAALQLSSSSGSIQLPQTITTGRGQTTVQFQIDAALRPVDRSAVITAQLGAETVQETVTIGGEPSRVHVRNRKFVQYGTEVRFSMFDPASGSNLSAFPLPAGASFEPGTGIFAWTPTESQKGTYEVAFTELSSSGELVTENVDLQVEAGAPVISRVINAASHSADAACSPGSIGRIEGRWLTSESGNSDASVRINGDAVQVLAASSSGVDFLCPNAIPDSQMEIVVETAGRRSPAVYTTARELSPGVFSLDGSGTGQGMVMHGDGFGLAMIRNFRHVSQPAQAGDAVSLFATGVEGAAKLSVRVGGREVTPDSVSRVPGLPGLWLVSVTLPKEVPTGDRVGLSISGQISNGARLDSNQISIAIEGPGR